MLMHGEIKWLLAYQLILAGAVVASKAAAWKPWKSAALALVGVPVIAFGWLWQVGRWG
jgi:hypothetical protein